MEILKKILNIFTPQKTGAPQFVDLGLPSGLKWAKCNVGAKKETDYGDYFMWGSIIPNTADACIWANAPFNNGSSSCNKTYFNSVKDTVCPNGILAKEYDAAAQIMGDEWRMPTRDEFQELLDNTDNEWIEDFNGTGANGWKFISKTDTSKYIFIPASGFRLDYNFYLRGSDGYYWSSSPHPSLSTHGLCLNFYSGGVNPQNLSSRFIGFCVRSVSRNK